jgi:hypothetical protein
MCRELLTQNIADCQALVGSQPAPFRKVPRDLGTPGADKRCLPSMTAEQATEMNIGREESEPPENSLTSSPEEKDISSPFTVD